jgi:hypothetical protein
MRIDPVLCHKILVAVESDANAGSGQFLRIAVDGYEKPEIAHHIKYLWDDGLVEGRDVTHLTSPYPEIMVLDITPAGRRSLDEREPEPPPRKIGF